MFTGFPKAYIPFLLSLEMSNNREFFEENREVYARVLKEPLYALAEALGPCVRAIDAGFDTRPSRAVSRINRDVRFSNDKSPYRTYMWVGFRHMGEAREETCGFYFDISATAAHFGCGYYHMQPAYMENLRSRIAQRPGHILAILEEEAFARTFEIKGERYQRKFQPPEGLPPALASLYTHKSVYAEHTIDDIGAVFSPRLKDQIEEGFQILAPFYTLLSECMATSAKEGNR